MGKPTGALELGNQQGSRFRSLELTVDAGRF